jgi:hypothetical protein
MSDPLPTQRTGTQTPTGGPGGNAKPVGGVEHVRASMSTLWLIALLGSILGLVLAIGGIYLAVGEHLAQTNFNLFGQQFSSTSVGVSMAFIGAVVIVLTLRRVLKSLDYHARLPPDYPNYPPRRRRR